MRACRHVIYVYGRAAARTATYVTCCAAWDIFGNQAGHNAQPLDSSAACCKRRAWCGCNFLNLELQLAPYIFLVGLKWCCSVAGTHCAMRTGSGSGPGRVTWCLGLRTDSGRKKTRHNNLVRSLKERARAQSYTKNGSGNGPGRVTWCLGLCADSGRKKTRHNNLVRSLMESARVCNHIQKTEAETGLVESLGVLVCAQTRGGKRQGITTSSDH